MKSFILVFSLVSSFSAFARVSDFGILTLMNAQGTEVYYSTITNIEVSDQYLEIFTANKKHKYASCKIAFTEVSDGHASMSPVTQRALETINANIGKNTLNVVCQSRNLTVEGKLKSITMEDGPVHGNWLRVAVGKAFNPQYD